MNDFTTLILSKIEVFGWTQKQVAELCANAIMRDMELTDWPAINAAIVKRWSKSARERVLRMAWKIVEKSMEKK